MGQIVDVAKRRMKTALKEIQNGKFARLDKEYEAGYKQYNKLLKAGETRHRKGRGPLAWHDALDEKRRMGGSEASY